MKRIFQRVSLSGFEIPRYHFRRSPKISIVAGFMVIFFFLLNPGFPHTLNNFKPGSEPAGLGKIYWGGDITAMKNLEYCRTDPSYGGIDIYRNTGSAPCLCGLAGEKIEYLFWKRRFCGVCYFEEGFTGYEQVREAAFKEFGKVKKPSPDQEYYVWEGEKTLMALEYNPLGKRILFWMLSVSLLRQMEQLDKY
jgi:hypothetical protein